MLLDFLFFGIVAALIIPTISGYYAYTHGRSFWLWFCVGLCLPIVSYFILLLLPDKTHPLEKALEQLRIQNQMLGTKPDFPPYETQLRTQLREKPLNSIAFVLTRATEDAEDTIEPVIDGLPLRELVKEQERALALHDAEPVLAGAYRGLPAKFVVPPAKHLLGKPHLFFRDKHESPAILVCQESGMMEQWALMTTIEVFPRHIVWRRFYHLQRPKTWQYTGLGPFIFDKLQYTDALHAVYKNTH